MAVLAVSEAGAGYIYPRPVGTLLRYANSYTRPSYTADTLTVLAEQPYAVDNSLAAVPLVVIPQDHLRIVQHARISSISPTKPTVTVEAPSLPTEQEAMPAVRVVLQKPMYVNSMQSTIPFPAGFTVLHEGLRMPIPVGAVLAPVPSGSFITAARPIAIHVVYAIPSGPLHVQYPFHTRFPIGGPLLINPSTGSVQPLGTTTAIAAAPSKPANAPEPPQQPQRPQQPQQPQGPIVSSGRPVITVLDFPTSVSSPSVLVFQPPTLSEGSDLGNREPPQAVVPAGIVQSTAPRPVESVFGNSKDNEFLQQMRDEAQRRPQQDDYNHIIEALYN
ncbi:serine/threonine-protein kinase WNK2 [Anabrus simplex]|uniref:serine/threonine-protein kinase WNK2 n=1 Tax=Anabrus simplex TaxID=316456 RepID=UPI0035A28E0F